jgi:hypothetical protein
MSLRKIILGDFYGDGHGITDHHLVNIPKKFTDEILAYNYQKNVKELGVDPEMFANTYEDTSLPQHVLDVMTSHGVELEGDEDYEDPLVVTSNDMVKILMFLFGHGLEGFTYEVVSETIPSLNGTGRNGLPGSVGYGLYFT